MDLEVRLVKRVIGQQVYDSRMPEAKRKALKYARNGGYVASLPQILQSRAISPKDSEIWNYEFTANSEENVGKTRQGHTVVVVVHGTGIWTPDRIQEAYEVAYEQWLTSPHASKIGRKEFLGVLDGKLANGTTIPIYTLSDFMKGISDLTMQYGVVMDFDKVKCLNSGVQNIDSLRNNPLFIVRAGGQEPANQFLDQVKAVYGRDELANLHPFASTSLDHAWGRVLFAGESFSRGLGSCICPSSGRFVWVAPEALDMQANITTDLETRIRSKYRII